MYYVRFETSNDNYSLFLKVSKYLDWVADQFGMVVDAPWTIFEDQKFWKRKLNDWSLIIWSQEGNRMIEYQKYWKSRSIIRVSTVLYVMPLHLRLIIWSSEHFKSRKILAHCSKPESLKLIEQKPKMSPSHNKNLNGKTEYSIDLMP